MSIKSALIVDDSKSARLILQRLLNSMNIQTESVDNAESALQFLDTNHPDIIFMDHMMPGMNGLEAIQIIKANPNTSRIPVIMCTSEEDKDYLNIARSCGASGVLPKPADQNAIMDIIAKLEGSTPGDALHVKQQSDIPLSEIDKLIKKHLNLALTEAKAEISAGLDSSTQQIQSLQTHQLDNIQQDWQQQLSRLQHELESSIEPQAIFQRIQPLSQKLAMSAANEVIKKSTTRLTLLIESQLQQAQSELNIQHANTQNTIRRSHRQTLFAGAITGMLTGSLAALLFTLLL